MWNYKVSYKTKKKKKKNWTKNALFGSLAGMLKTYCHISNKSPPNCLIAKLRTKISCLSVLSSNFEKTIVIFEISTLQFVLLESFVQKLKILKFGTTNVRFLYFGAGVSLEFPSNLPNCKTSWKNESTKMSVFLDRNLKMILSYLKSAPSNLSYCKILWNDKST